MTYQLFQEVVLLKNIPEKGLQKGDVATIIDHHVAPNGEDGYSVEVFNAVGETVVVITLPASAISSLRENEIFSVRRLAVV